MLQKSSHDIKQQPGFLSDLRLKIQNSPEVRSQVVDDVSRRIASGSYYIQVDRIVEKLLSHDDSDRI